MCGCCKQRPVHPKEVELILNGHYGGLAGGRTGKCSHSPHSLELYSTVIGRSASGDITAIGNVRNETSVGTGGQKTNIHVVRLGFSWFGPWIIGEVGCRVVAQTLYKEVLYGPASRSLKRLFPRIPREYCRNITYIFALRILMNSSRYFSLGLLATLSDLDGLKDANAPESHLLCEERLRHTRQSPRIKDAIWERLFIV